MYPLSWPQATQYTQNHWFSWFLGASVGGYLAHAASFSDAIYSLTPIGIQALSANFRDQLPALATLLHTKCHKMQQSEKTLLQYSCETDYVTVPLRS